MQLTTVLLALVSALTFGLAAPIDRTATRLTNSLTQAISKRESFTGIATVYSQNGVYGSCGDLNPDSAMVGSVSPSFGSNALCGRRIRITNTGPTTDYSVGGAGNAVEVAVADTCPGCDRGHLDLSVAAWDALTGGAYPSQVGISWSLM